MIRYLIVDDEFMAHDIIKTYCDALPYMELSHQCYDAFEALEYLQQNKVDLIFLDINMPKLKGFDFLKTLSNPPQIIVTTAYSEFAVESYELDVADYLLKPFSFERLVKALNKINTPKSSKETKEETVSELEQTNDYIYLYADKTHIRTAVAEILFIEAAGNYLKVHLKSKSILVRHTLSEFLNKLPSTQFLQVHKSFVVAKHHIDRIEGNRLFIEKSMIPVGKSFKKQVSDLWK